MGFTMDGLCGQQVRKVCIGHVEFIRKMKKEDKCPLQGLDCCDSEEIWGGVGEGW
jgi:hypothetical protein